MGVQDAAEGTKSDEFRQLNDRMDESTHAQRPAVYLGLPGIRLGVEDRRLVLTVQDDGIGMPEHLGADRGMGLHIMPYRAHRIGAVFTVGRLRRGTLVSCVLPLDGTAPLMLPEPPRSALEDRRSP